MTRLPPRSRAPVVAQPPQATPRRQAHATGSSGAPCASPHGATRPASCERQASSVCPAPLDFRVSRPRRGQTRNARTAGKMAPPNRTGTQPCQDALCSWRTGGLSRSRRGDLSRNQSGATGPSGHERQPVHAVNGKQGFQPDGPCVGRVYGAPSCASGEMRGVAEFEQDPSRRVEAGLLARPPASRGRVRAGDGKQVSLPDGRADRRVDDAECWQGASRAPSRPFAALAARCGGGRRSGFYGSAGELAAQRRRTAAARERRVA